MNRIITAPGKFIIGNGELNRLNDYISGCGSPVMLVAHRDDAARVKYALDKVTSQGTVIIEGDFAGEATRAESDRIGEMCRENRCKTVIGLGGGKAIDIAKLVAFESSLPVIVVPTIASTDAPCSRLSVLYNDRHEWAESVKLPSNPDLVLVDSAVIARAPERFLVAGMGDAFATYYEARACVRSGSPNYVGAAATKAAFALAEVCNKILLEDSVKALHACRANIVTQALENIIEANILLSGIGFESAGLSVAHAVEGGFTQLPETAPYMHGERVAVGTLVQLILENAPTEELQEVLTYYRSVGLPTNLAAIGIAELTDEKLSKIVDAIFYPGSCLYHVPFKVDEAMVRNAISYVNFLDEITK